MVPAFLDKGEKKVPQPGRIPSLPYALEGHPRCTQLPVRPANQACGRSMESVFRCNTSVLSGVACASSVLVLPDSEDHSGAGLEYQTGLNYSYAIKVALVRRSQQKHLKTCSLFDQYIASVFHLGVCGRLLRARYGNRLSVCGRLCS